MIQEIEADLNRSYKMQSEREKQKKNEDLSRQQEEKEQMR